MHFTNKALAAAAVLGVVAAGGSAFTASNTVDAVKAGQGASTTSGYTIGNVTQTLGSGSDGDKITQVKFTTNAFAAQAKVRLVSGGTYYDCASDIPLTGLAWTCTIPSVAASAVNTLDVVAVSQTAGL